MTALRLQRADDDRVEDDERLAAVMIEEGTDQVVVNPWHLQCIILRSGCGNYLDNALERYGGIAWDGMTGS